VTMAKKPPKQPPPGPPQIPPHQAITLLDKHVQLGEQLLATAPVAADQHSSWVLVASNLLEKAFGAGSPNISAVADVGKHFPLAAYADKADLQEHRARSLRTQLSKMKALIELLRTEAELQSPSHVIHTQQVTGHRIFLVHGRDERYIHEVARFLEKLQQDVIILRDEPNQGRTIIEKFEDYANVGFAVVLLTPDDQGGLREKGVDALQPRARQNVIFELGYFIGKLSRKRVCALYIHGVEKPSDYDGVLFVQLDEGGAWRLQLARELKAAGLSVDMNLAL
jgi:predicted nucleotide-binding protein